MRKLFVFSIALLLLSSCSFISQTASHSRFDIKAIAAPVLADLDVSKTKITYAYAPVPYQIRNLGLDNVINAAVRAALIHYDNGYSDVLVGLETEIKYHGYRIESVVVSGYPAKYTNFRSANDADWVENSILLNISNQKENSTKRANRE